MANLNQRGKNNHNYSHGEGSKNNRTKEYGIWSNMIQRCGNVRHHSYKYYGGRGISVCERWLVYENFLSDMGRKPPRHSLDRIDNAGNYEPANCRWATQSEQIRNSSHAKYVTIDGRTKLITEWIHDLGLVQSTVNRRIKRGWSPEKALTAPTRKVICCASD